MLEPQLEQKFTLDEIYPEINVENLVDFLNEYDKKISLKLKKIENLDDIPEDLLGLFNQVYISKTLKSTPAIKARFMQYLDFADEFKQYLVDKKDFIIKNQKVDIILEHKEKEENIWIIFLEYYDRLSYNKLEKMIIEIFDKKNNMKGEKNETDIRVPEEIYLVCAKVDRRSALEKLNIQIGNTSIKLSFLIEYNDPNRPFNDEDFIIIDDMKIRGFNFNSLDYLLNVVKSTKGKGQYHIKIENPQGERKIIWEGIIFPKNIFKKE